MLLNLMVKHACHVPSFNLIKIMDNFVGMNVKIFMIFFLIAVSNISFYHFSPYSNVLTLSQNNCRNLKTFQAASQYNGD